MLKKLMLIIAVVILAAGSSQAQRQANREEVKIQTNLDCESCKKRIEHHMAFERGVTAVEADVNTSVVTLQYRSNRTDEEKLVAALVKLGYEAEVIEEKDEKKE